MNTLITSAAHCQQLAKKIARLSKITYFPLEQNTFPDGELYLRLTKPVKNKHVIYLHTMHPAPNNAILQSILFAHTAKELGAKTVTLIAPYHAYLRQDKRFKPGESLSNHIIAQQLAIYDHVITIDPHLHRINSLSEIYNTRTTSLSANDTLAQWIKKNRKHAIIIGPDAESHQWAQSIAQSINHDFAVLTKTRHTSRKVTIHLDDPARYNGRDVIIIDDIISTGHTMIEPIKQLKKARAKTITCLCVHALLVENAQQHIEKLGARIISTDTIKNPTTALSIAPLLAKAL